MKKSLLFIDGEQVKESLDLIAVSKALYPEQEYETYAVSNKDLSRAMLGSVNHMIRVEGSRIEEYDTKNLAHCISKMQEEYQFDSILIPATWIGRMLAPRLAVLLHTGLTADVTEIHAQKEQILLIRPAFSGRLMASIKPLGKGPVMMSVRANAFQCEPGNQIQDHIIYFKYLSEGKCGIRQTGFEKKEKSYDISESEILISGGGGVINDFWHLEELAQVLNGQVAASRKIIDKGIAQRFLQVGQSGKIVSPKLYIALGISGAIQHIEGLKKVENLITVNTSRNAPICSIADLVVEGDAHRFIEMIVERIEKYRAEQTKE